MAKTCACGCNSTDEIVSVWTTVEAPPRPTEEYFSLPCVKRLGLYCEKHDYIMGAIRFPPGAAGEGSEAAIRGVCPTCAIESVHDMDPVECSRLAALAQGHPIVEQLHATTAAHLGEWFGRLPYYVQLVGAIVIDCTPYMEPGDTITDAVASTIAIQPADPVPAH